MQQSISKIDYVTLFIILCSLLLRLWLCVNYYGWEESDYGNLAMIYGVWESGFTYYDMNHMPGYYFAAAILYGLVQDSVIAGIAASMMGGMIAYLCAIGIVRELTGAKNALLCAVLLALQPEWTLYSSSSLREPVYSAFIMMSLWCLLHQRTGWFTLFGVLAFSVRFEAPLFLLPIGGLFLPSRKEIFTMLMAFGIGIGCWMLYCSFQYDTIQFWAHAASVNVETGGGGESQDAMSRWMHGFSIVLGLLFEMIPKHCGWGMLLGIMTIPIFWKSSKRMMLLWTWGILMLGLWLGVAFVAQHEVGHNLYWKWFYPVVPMLAILTSISFGRFVARLKRQKLVFILFGMSILIPQGQELQRQFALSKTLYGPQVQLGEWIEKQVSADVGLLVDNVPACWLKRKPNDWRLYSWFDVPEFQTPQELLQWSVQNNIQYVLYFEEEWTQAPSKAKFLHHPSQMASLAFENVHLEFRQEERSYGWILYEIVKK